MGLAVMLEIPLVIVNAVSYTHLDVYKRQTKRKCMAKQDSAHRALSRNQCVNQEHGDGHRAYAARHWCDVAGYRFDGFKINIAA